ncbi:MAG: ribosome small subunit-dependent GTPase A [Nannocystaceae bacterium]
MAADSRGVYGPRRRSASGVLRVASHALEARARPVTGDWVAVSDDPERRDPRKCYPRKTVLRRRAASTSATVQVVAANVDRFFIVTAAGRDLNLRRIERYLTAVWDGGAEPVVVLNKVDLVEDITPLRATLEAVALGVTILCVSASSGVGMAALAERVTPGVTIGFVGSSGVGKSTLINHLAGARAQETGALRGDGKGRHTTTRRELVVLPGGGVLIDTPGMREFGLLDDDGGLDTTFSDVAALAEACRFRDCQHGAEPGCAVQAALADGALDPARLRSYLALQREIAAAEARRVPAQAANTKRRWKTIHKAIRAHARIDPKRRG